MNDEQQSRARREEATELLGRLETEADPERLLALVYDELRSLAHHYLGREREDHTLQATALVHEAYVRLVGADEIAWKDHRHFFSTAARAMRRILVDHARGKGRAKRGGEWERVPLDPDSPAEEQESMNVVAVHRALEALARHSKRQADIVELRYFAGLEISAIAKVLTTSERTVQREWRFARAWLLEYLKRS